MGINTVKGYNCNIYYNCICSKCKTKGIIEVDKIDFFIRPSKCECKFTFINNKEYYIRLCMTQKRMPKVVHKVCEYLFNCNSGDCNNNIIICKRDNCKKHDFN